MGTINGLKVAAVAGIVFVVLTLVSGFLVQPPPAPNESATKFLEYYSDHRNGLLAQGVIALLSNIPSFLFIAGLWRILRRDDADEGILATAALVAFAVLAAITSVYSVMAMGIAMTADGNGLTEELARTLGVASELVNPGIFATAAGFTGITGYVLLRGTWLPRWLGWLALLIALAMLAATPSVATSGGWQPYGFLSFISFLALMVWIVITSVYMWLRSEPA